MQTYETVLITAPNLPEEDEQTTVDSLRQIVSDGGGELVTLDRMGRRRLAYPIRKFDEGNYFRLLSDSSHEVPHELERRARLSDHVLRSMTVRLEEDWARGAKEQVVIDAQRRAEAEEQARREAEEQARREAEEQARRAAEGDTDSETGTGSETVSSETVSADGAAETEGAERPAPADSAGELT